MIIMSDYQRGIIKGMTIAEDFFLKQLLLEKGREGIPFKQEYIECCSFIGILFIKKFAEFMVDLVNQFQKENNNEKA